MKAKEVAGDRRRIEQATLELKNEREVVIHESTEFQIDQIDRGLRQLANELYEVGREEGRLIQAAPKPARFEEIAELIQESLHKEQRLMSSMRFTSSAHLNETFAGSTLLPSKYVRLDAEKHFHVDIEAAEQELAKLRGRHYGPNLSPGPRVVEKIRELELVIDEWPATQKLCAAGVEIAKLREERQRLTQERQELERQHRADALAV